MSATTGSLPDGLAGLEYRIDEVVVATATTDAILKSSWLKTRIGPPPADRKGRVDGVMDVEMTGAEAALRDWVRMRKGEGATEGWFERSIATADPIASNGVLWLQGPLVKSDPDDARLALALQDIEHTLDGRSLLPRDVLVRIFSALSPAYKSTCGRWLLDPVGCKYEAWV